MYYYSSSIQENRTLSSYTASRVTSAFPIARPFEPLKCRPDDACAIFVFFWSLCFWFLSLQEAVNEWASAIATFVRTSYMKGQNSSWLLYRRSCCVHNFFCTFLLIHTFTWSFAAHRRLISTKEFPFAICWRCPCRAYHGVKGRILLALWRAKSHYRSRGEHNVSLCVVRIRGVQRKKLSPTL